MSKARPIPGRTLPGAAVPAAPAVCTDRLPGDIRALIEAAREQTVGAVNSLLRQPAEQERLRGAAARDKNTKTPTSTTRQRVSSLPKKPTHRNQPRIDVTPVTKTEARSTTVEHSRCQAQLRISLARTAILQTRSNRCDRPLWSPETRRGSNLGRNA